VLFLHNTAADPRQDPLPDDKHPRLLREKGFRGFPSVCFMDAEGNVLSQHPQRTVEGFREGMTQAKRVAELRGKGDKATPEEQKELLLIEVRNGTAKRDGLQERADKLSLSGEEKTLVADKIVEMEVTEIIGRSRDDGPEKTGKALAAMLAAGKTPKPDSQAWPALLRHASTAKDAELAQRAFDVLEQQHGSNQRMARQMEGWKKQLEDAKAK
jgi:hypothetical protein